MIEILKKYYMYIAIGLMIILSIVLSIDFSKEVETQEEITINEQEINNSFIYVDIRGEVINPGVYKVDQNTRLFQLIIKAGGLTAEADEHAINQSIMLTDEMYIYVPNKSEEKSDVYNNEIKELVNINTATQSELETLPGIGPSTANAIIDYRDSISNFSTIEDIMNVTGIGEATYNEIKYHITV